MGLWLALASCDQLGTVTAPKEDWPPAAELDGGLTWINSRPLQLAELRGKVVLLDFFEYSCVNCLRTFPYLKEWQRRYADRGLVIIGVHTPQYGFSMNPLNVYAAVARFGQTYPVVVDSDFAIADAYHNRFWPRKFLVDQAGRIRFDHTGEGAYIETELKIQQLLHEIDPRQTFPEVMQPLRGTDRPGAVCYPITAELYLGNLRGQVGNTATQDETGADVYSLPNELEIQADRIYVHGAWETQSEYLRHTRDTDEGLEDFLLLRYHAVEVNVVMKPEGVYWMKILVEQDGTWLPRASAGADILYDEAGRSYVKVDAARMYNLIADQPYGSHALRLVVGGKGLSVYSMSFGTCVMPEDVDRLSPRKDR